MQADLTATTKSRSNFTGLPSYGSCPDFEVAFNNFEKDIEIEKPHSKRSSFRFSQGGSS